jgi:murein DD-endopeptidase MepM/ murein hydrolase activator NlpD
MKMQKKGIKELRMEALAQREQLSVLQEQTNNIQLLLSNWKGLQERIQSSLPSQNKSSVGSHLAIGELEKSLASLQRELERLISSVPTAMPANGRMTSGVGTRPSPWTGKPEFHSGLDIPNPVGTPVYATGDGVVESAGVSNGNGQTVVLNHGQGIVTQYAHLSKIQVKKGDRVRKGQQIAKSGNTGKSTSPHLHYEVRINGVPIDPRPNLIIKQNSPSS